MREIDTILLQVERHIQHRTYTPIETDKIELKDLSSGGNWRELYKSVCAFLNTKGGTIIIGIKEDVKAKQFVLTGYDSNNENKIQEICKIFTDDNGNKLDLTDYIRPDLVEVKPFFDKQICVIFVEKLPQDMQYVYYEGDAFERKLTGDHTIQKERILK
jgi:ATP-dependent DNA helicase RecG